MKDHGWYGLAEGLKIVESVSLQILYEKLLGLVSNEELLVFSFQKIFKFMFSKNFQMTSLQRILLGSSTKFQRNFHKTVWKIFYILVEQNFANNWQTAQDRDQIYLTKSQNKTIKKFQNKT